MEKKEESKLMTISLDDLEKVGLATADVCSLLGRSQKEVILLRAGEYVLPSFIDKFRAKGVKSFILKNHFDPQEIDLWKAAWKQISSVQDAGEYDQYISRKEFISHFKSLYFDEKVSTSLLSFMSTTHHIFVALSNDFMSEYAEKNFILFKRSILVASLSLPLLLSYGYSDWQFLKDVYNTTLLLSFHLADEKFTVTMKNALTLESKEQGYGHQYLSLKSPKEVDHLINVQDLTQICSLAYDYKNEHIKDLFYYFHSAYKKQSDQKTVVEQEMPDWASAIIFVDRLIPYEDITFKSGDASGYMKKVIKSRFSDQFIKSYGFNKIRNLLKDFWEVSEEELKHSA
jgi:hypothetical protein